MRLPLPSAPVDPIARVARRTLLAAPALLCARRALAAASVTIEADTRDAPQLAPWAQEARRRAYGWWTIIGDELGTPDYRPPSRITFRFRNDMPAEIAGQAEEGDAVNLNAPYIAAHPTYFNYLAHELVHVFQGYGRHAEHPWLTESVADYVRYYVIFPQDRERLFDPRLNDYRRGYQQGAALLDWVERTQGPGSVRRINAALRRGQDGEALIERMTGRRLDDIWKAVVDDLVDGSPVPVG